MRVGFAYAQARIAARLARHPEEAVWGHLATGRTLAAYLSGVRRSPMAPWVAPLAATATPHAIERALRAEAWRVVAEVARWVAGGWRPAVAWMRYLVVVELFAATGEGAAPPWLEGDPPLAATLASGVAEVAVAEGEPPLVAWLTGWERRWPDRSPAVVAERLGRLGSPSLPATGAGGQVRMDLLRLVHRRPAEPVAALAYLTLAILDLARLCGELVARACFEEAGE